MLTHITLVAFELFNALTTAQVKHKHGTVTPAADGILALSVKLYTIHGRGVPFQHSYQIFVGRIVNFDLILVQPTRDIIPFGDISMHCTSPSLLP